MKDPIFNQELLDKAVECAGLRIRGEPKTLEKGRNRLSYLRKSNRSRYGHLLFTWKRDADYLDIINTAKKLAELEEIFS